MAFRYRGSIGGSGQSAVLMPWPCSSAIAEGALVDVSSGLAVTASNGSTAVLGVTAHAVAATDTSVKVYVDPNAIFEVPFYTGGSKKLFADTDLGSAFDIRSGALMVDPDDVTGAMCIVIGYDNEAETATVKIKAASRKLT